MWRLTKLIRSCGSATTMHADAMDYDLLHLGTEEGVEPSNHANPAVFNSLSGPP